MIMTETTQKIIDICLEVIEMEADEIGLDDEFRSFAHIDSLKALDLMTALERHFRIKLNESALREFETIGKVVAVMERALSQQPANA
jgi:acyl carrier protein